MEIGVATLVAKTRYDIAAAPKGPMQARKFFPGAPAVAAGALDRAMASSSKGASQARRPEFLEIVHRILRCQLGRIASPLYHRDIAGRKTGKPRCWAKSRPAWSLRSPHHSQHSPSSHATEYAQNARVWRD